MIAPHSKRAAPFAVSRPKSAFGFLGLMVRATGVWRQRRALSRLDDAALRDIGLTRAEADAEVERPFWDVPSNWRR